MKQFALLLKMRDSLNEIYDGVQDRAGSPPPGQ